MKKSNIIKWVFIVLVIYIYVTPLYGINQDEELEKLDLIKTNSPYRLTKNPFKERGFFLYPIVSFFLPGFGQWVEHQFTYAPLYSSLAIGGLVLTISTDPTIAYEYGYEDTYDERLGFLGYQFIQFAGFMSSYHSFRSAVWSRDGDEKLSFLKHEESPSKLFLAPFNFKMLSRWTTLVPLFVIEPILLLSQMFLYDDVGVNPLTIEDIFFSGIFSYNAGVSEEAFFHGYVQPVSRYYIGNELIANLIASTLFALAHITDDYKQPYFQFLFGVYLGYLCNRNEYSLIENIFIHTWWDVFALLTEYTFAENRTKQYYLPLITVPF